MRKINAIITAAIIIVFIFHGGLGSFMMAGITEQGDRIVAWLGCLLIIIHTVIGFIITGRTIKSGIKSKKWYLNQNKEFWIRRISGLIIFAIMFIHFSSFRKMDDNNIYQLTKFLADNMIVQLIFLISIFIHLSTNIRPMLISMGIVINSRIKKILMPLSVVILVLFCGAVIFYYIRWNIL